MEDIKGEATIKDKNKLLLDKMAIHTALYSVHKTCLLPQLVTYLWYHLKTIQSI